MKMHLLKLPSEILLEIIKHLKADFFREDLRRLSLCKRWYRLSRPILARDLSIPIQSLRHFIEPLKDDPTKRFVQEHLKELSLNFDLIRDCAFLGWTTRSSPRDRLPRWRPTLLKDVATLYKTAPDFPRLRSVKVAGLVAFFSDRIAMDVPFDVGSALSFLRVDSLTSLVIDLEKHSDCYQVTNTDRHSCGLTSAIPQTLQRLHVGLPVICPDILKIGVRGQGVPRLQSVIINLSIKVVSNWSTMSFPPRWCTCTAHEHAVDSLRECMEAQARKLVRRLPDARMVRILSHRPGSNGGKSTFYTYDAISKRRMRISKHSRWDSDGEALETDDEA